MSRFSRPAQLREQRCKPLVRCRVSFIPANPRAHLDDDNDTSICATFFNAATVITPINDPAIYNMLIKPHYPVNMQYILDGMRAWPIPNDTRADGVAAKARAMGVNGEDAAYGKGGEYGGKEVVYRHVVEEAAECRIAQVGAAHMGWPSDRVAESTLQKHDVHALASMQVGRATRLDSTNQQLQLRLLG